MIKVDRERFKTRKEFAILCGDGKEINHSTLIKAIKTNLVTETKSNNTYYVDLEAKNTIAYLEKKQTEAIEKKQDLPKSLDIQKKELEIRRVQEDLRLKEIKRQRMEKEAIPTALIYPIYEQFYSETWKQVHYNMEEWITTLFKRYQVPKIDQAKHKGELVDLLNKVIDNTKENCIGATNSVIANYNDDE